MIDRIINLLGLGKVTVVDDSGETQRIQVTEGAAGSGYADRVTDKVLRLTEFGFTSVMPIDAEVLVINRGGDRSKPIAIATSHRSSRPRNLQPGDAGIYDIRGAKVMLTADGLVIDCAGLPAIVQNATTITLRASDSLTIDAPALTVTGTISASGVITSDSDVVTGSKHLSAT